MNVELISQLVFFVLSVGVIYGSFNTRVKSIEKQLNEQKDIGERLARIEEQNKIILEFIKK